MVSIKHGAKAGVLLEANSKIRKNIAKNPDTDEPLMLSGEVDALLRWSELQNRRFHRCASHGY